MKARVLFCLLALGGTGATAAGVEEDLGRCRDIADSAQRLDCYDALAHRSAQTAPANFGKSQAAPEEPKSIQARLMGGFKEWKPGTQFELDNDQVWKAVEDSGYYPGIPDNPAVTIRKSFFGAYWMEVQGVGRKIKVRRVK